MPKAQPDSREAFFGLAVQAIRRECLDRVRPYKGPAWKALHAPGTPGADPLPSRPDVLDGSEDQSALHDAVCELPPAERELLQLLFYEGWSQAEVAARLGVRERTV
jgi:RNA polymerase sigma factor (sigma-70 family)